MSIAQSIARLGKHTGIYGIGHILTRSVAFLLLPLYTNILAPADYGAAMLVFSFLAIANIFFVYGIDSAFLRFFIMAEQPEQKRTILMTAMVTLSVSAIGFALLLFAGAGLLARLVLDDASAAPLFRLASGILLFETLAVIPYLLLRAQERSTLFGLLKFANVLAILFLNWYFLVRLHWGLEGVFRANLIAAMLLALSALPLLRGYVPACYSRQMLGKMLRFGLPYIPTTLAVILMDVIDRFLLEWLVDRATVGIYSAGYRIGMFMALLIAAFRFAWHPFFLDTAMQPHAPALFAKVFNYFLFACSAIFLAITYFINDLVRVRIGEITLFGEAYWQSTQIVPIIMLAYIFYGVYVQFVVGVHVHNKTHYLPLITGTAAVVNVLGNLVLIPPFGMVGAALATLASYAVMAMAQFAVNQRLYPVPYEFGRVARLVGVTALFLLPPILFDLGLLWRVALLLMFPLAVNAAGFLDAHERQRLRQMLGRLLNVNS